MRLDVHYHHDPDIARKLDRIEVALSELRSTLMATLADLQAEVAAVKTVEDSAEALIAGLAQQLKDALASNDPAAIQSIIDGLESSKTALAQSVAQNTPAAP